MIRSGVSFVYDTILRLGLIRYDLATRFGTISISEATYTTILSSGGAQIPIDLVSSATDSFW